MGMTNYTAYLYVTSNNKDAFYELTFENEAQPEIVLRDSFIKDFTESDSKKRILSDVFDSNALWDDSDPHTLLDEIADFGWMDVSDSEEYDDFCEIVQNMNDIEYILFAVDSNKENWMDYRTCWYDAKIVSFTDEQLISVEWRGTQDSIQTSREGAPFSKRVAKSIIQMLKKDQADKIDVGNFELNGKTVGRVLVRNIQGIRGSEKGTDIKKPDAGAESLSETAQIERILSMVKRIDELDFTDKAFVFDHLDYVPVNGEYCGPDSPNHPIVKRVLDVGGLMRKSVSGKTDYLVIDINAAMPGRGAKCRDALIQIDKGKNINIITLDNLLELLSK